MNAGSLRKVLVLEQKKGYADTAVIGGLDRFLKNWSAQAIDSISNPQVLKKFRKLFDKAEYASMSAEKRGEWVKGVLGFLEEVGAVEDKEKIPLNPPFPKGENRAGKARAVSPKTTKIVGVSIDSPITVIKGISTALEAKFKKLGVSSVRDMLYFFPRRHLDYSQRKTISQLLEGTEETIVANVWEARVKFIGGRRSTEAIVGDETGNVRVVWFNNPYITKKLTTGTRLVISGRVSVFQGRHVFQSPEWEILEEQELTHAGRLVPLYHLTEGLHPRQVRKLMKSVIDQWAGQLPDFLPDRVRGSSKLLELPRAITQAHFPESIELYNRARTRLAFDELFLLQLGVLGRKREWQQSQPGHPFKIDAKGLDRFVRSLPFNLTTAQKKALDEILVDLKKSVPMSRLLQGEVGSGKTVVALAALIQAVANGLQGAFMAPTEILAEQHFNTISALLSRLGEPQGEDKLSSFAGLLNKPITIALLIGDTKQSRKRELQQLIAEGKIDIIIGTHALIQRDVGFKALGLVVVDEQHRFGVEQRSALRQKGFNPHMLVMTATPIPRTLALTLYGDLDLTVIGELPPGRQVVKTKWLNPQQREAGYGFIKKQVEAGSQAFIICPLIEESEAVQARAAIAEYEHLSGEVFTDLKLGLLHGRLSSADKDEVMRRFHACELQILVSTPVVEVGIDVPNATVMLVESADRFGLSQLHQFRGRVGRGKEQSYCMLLSENPSLVAKQRLDIIETTQDGFKLAEQDLRLRGPGEFFGTRQSGLPDLRMAKMSDIAILELARDQAIKLFEVDPGLKQSEHKPLAQELARVWKSKSGEWS